MDKQQIIQYYQDHKNCPFCNQEIIISLFKDQLSIKEYFISGLCQSCQNNTFKT